MKEWSQAEKKLLEQIMPLQNQLLQTKTYGDGEIGIITRKNDRSGIFVYFNSRTCGQVRIDGEEFLEEIKNQ